MIKISFILSFFLSSSIFASIDFKGYCKLWKQDHKALGLELAHTIKVLYEVSHKQNCEDAFNELNRGYLNLSGKQIKDLSPLKSLTKIGYLDLSDNELESLWGLENLSELTVLIANNNKIQDIHALYYTNELKIVELKNNQIKYASPLKGLLSLYDYKLDENPIQESEEGKFLYSLMRERQKKSGFSYLMTKSEKSGEMVIQDEGLIKGAEWGDFLFYHNLLANVENNAILTDPSFLMSQPIKVKKMVLGVKYAEDVVENMIMNYKKIKKIDFKNLKPQIVKIYMDLFKEARKRLKPFFEYTLAEGTDFPHTRKDLAALERYLIKRMKQSPNLSPEIFKKQIKEWQQSIKKSGIPPSITTGSIF